MKPEVVSPMQKSMAESLGVAGSTSTTNTLTPTTLRNITQLFESEECLSSLKKYDETGRFVPPAAKLSPLAAVTTSSNTVASNNNKTFVNLDSKAWQGGLTTVVTPSTISPLLEGSLTDEERSQSPPTSVSSMNSVPAPAIAMRKSARTATRRSVGRYSNNTSVAGPATTTTASKRNGGRKPASYKSDDDMDPEESKRIHQRRLRNKEAAARCRKRRVDLTNKLLGEVEVWEAKKRAMEEEIRQLKGQKDELEFILQAHSHACKFQQSGPVAVPTVATTAQQQQQQQQQQQYTTTTMSHQQQLSEPGVSPPVTSMNLVVAVKSEPVVVEPANAPYLLPERVQLLQQEGNSRPSRPMSLSLDKAKEVEGVVIETPSSIIPALSFDNVTTGLTPMAPAPAPVIPSILVTPTLNTPTNCSSQQRSVMTAAEADAAPTQNTVDYLLL